jgi:cytochrome o ubiquinol oxidase subunit 3
MKEHTNLPAGMAGEKVAFGFWVYIMSDCVLFAGLFATYAVLRDATYGGATVVEIFDLPFVLTETLLLLTSSFTVGLALLFAHQRKKGKTFAALLVTLLLGLGFLTLELYEFMHLIEGGNGPSQSAFLSAFFTLLGTHGLHVATGALWLVLLMVQIYLRGLHATTIRRLTLLALFWHFLDVVWIFIFTFVYLFGALAL